MTEQIPAIKDASAVIQVLDDLAYACYENSRIHGFHDEIQDHPAIKLALIHSEVSELLEAVRFESKQGHAPMDKNCPQFLSEEIEAADILIRLMDYAKMRGLRIGAAVLAKHKFNASRPILHGKRF